MKKVISASRRTDLVAFFPRWFSRSAWREEAQVYGPSGYTCTVDLRPSSVHTMVLWSKNFSNLLQNNYGLADNLKKYDQLYLHFTITGLGGTFIESHVPFPFRTLSQIGPLLKLVGKPRRISIRFDPVVYWREGEKVKTNLYYFEKMAPRLKEFGIKDIRFSFAQWYKKARRRADKRDFDYVDPSPEEKKKAASYLSQIAQKWDLNLYACSQKFLEEGPGVEPSACIDGNLLRELHPGKEPASTKKDESQRRECHCTESVDIGSYTQFCPHCCLYCYANPRL
ncbi:DUF1848 family protein [bacterium]|nr:DUF1848 family protein [bacterium]